ncbi:hypothetical protein D6V26_13880 [Vibrio cholerae]|nr:hypothetical protein [Vibrio cholerae]
MEHYTIFAYFTMFLLLFLLLRTVLQMHFWFKAFDEELYSIRLKLKDKNWHELRHHTLASGSTPVSKADLIETNFAPVIAKLNHAELLSSNAPTAGMFFTLTSFIMAAQSFSDGGNVQTMFKAVAVGMGTTAIASFIVFLARVLLSQAENKLNGMLNEACDISSCWHKKLNEVKRLMHLKRAG